MNKTAYITPQAKVIKLATAPVLAPGSVQLDPNQEITNQDGFGSREFDYDEEEE